MDTCGTVNRRSRMKIRSYRNSRLALVGLIITLLSLGGFALWSAIHGESSAQRLKHSRLLSDAFTQARFAMDDERLLEHQYSVGHGGNYMGAAAMSLHQRFDAYADSADKAFASISHLGSPADRQLATRLAADQARYHRSTDQLFRAASGSNSMAADMHGAAADRQFETLKSQVSRATDQHSRDALGNLNSLAGTEHGVKTGTILIIPLALLLSGAFAVVLRSFRRREQEHQRAELARLERQALIDNLTELRNHRAFEEDLARELMVSERSGRPLTLALLDLDNLKRVNDSLGHQVGDQRLKALADAIRTATRGADAGYRVGGDEFALILSETPTWAAMRTVQRVQTELAAITGGQQRATGGVADARSGDGRDALIGRADRALIEAKAAERAMLIFSSELEIEPSNETKADGVRRMEPEELARALARAVDAKDSLTHSHSETVAETCVLIGSRLGLDSDHLAKLRIAGLLHDVGKIGIPDSILLKPDWLTEAEFELMKAHPVLGHGIVVAAKMDDEANWILHHHERFDGQGYPDGLLGEAIPLESRIILVADAFEAVISGRPYRGAMTEAQALAEVDAHAGSQFDESVVTALHEVLRDTPDSTRPPPGGTLEIQDRYPREVAGALTARRSMRA